MFVCLWLHSASRHLVRFYSLLFSMIRNLLLTNVSCLLPSPLTSDNLILWSILLSQLFLHLPSYLTCEADCRVLVLVGFLAAFNDIASLQQWPHGYHHHREAWTLLPDAWTCGSDGVKYWCPSKWQIAASEMMVGGGPLFCVFLSLDCSVSVNKFTPVNLERSQQRTEHWWTLCKVVVSGDGEWWVVSVRCWCGCWVVVGKSQY